jgi:hypothetical protein
MTPEAKLYKEAVGLVEEIIGAIPDPWARVTVLTGALVQVALGTGMDKGRLLTLLTGLWDPLEAARNRRPTQGGGDA